MSYVIVNANSNEAYLLTVLKLLKSLHEFNSQFDSSFAPSSTFEQQVEYKYYQQATGSTTEEHWILVFDGARAAALAISSLHRNMFQMYVEIEALWVEPQYQKRGLGRILVYDAIEWAQNIDVQDVRLFISEGNTNALKFYEYLEFKTLQRVLKLNLSPAE